MQLFSLAGSGHHRVQTLLPWYVNGALEPAEQAEVEAHLASCADCQSELAFERRLAGEVAAMPVEAAQGWARLESRLTAVGRQGFGDRLARMFAGLARGWRARPAWAAPALAAQIGLVGVFAAILLAPKPAPEPYKALAASSPAPPANVVVIFRPETTEARLRAILRQADARLVDGPTSADAYLLQVPAGARPAALARLKASGQVSLAEPVDAPPQ
jgi:anti-sigma factor RsiW